ncbi:TetR/AcrR family transcriptional regulator [Paenirhodobacter populi]|uniref:TetR/AcrR family transcriptional regulator n=1 Tax=Paenirhodobacter populi TaxID=2306993 RepID=A0A443JIT5_9RHOB|nr:TetR/AcrR family transcriptional regulator [Sinirhodobacter populi]RWR20519.1 TetR/AcrR family transcriptional regulator [Sinirhodobacter populi]
MTDETGDNPREAPPRKPRTRGPSPEKTAQTRSCLLHAALDEFVENGFAGAQMSRITERAGIAKGTAYRYFPTKSALFEGVVAEFMAPLISGIGPPEPRADESVGDFLRRSLIPVMTTIETSRRADVARLVLAEGRNFPFIVQAYRREAYDRTIDFVRAAARIAMERGELTDDRLLRHPQLIFAPLWLAMIETGILVPDAPVSGAELLAEQIDLIFPPSR